MLEDLASGFSGAGSGHCRKVRFMTLKGWPLSLNREDSLYKESLDTIAFVTTWMVGVETERNEGHEAAMWPPVLLILITQDAHFSIFIIEF